MHNGEEGEEGGSAGGATHTQGLGDISCSYSMCPFPLAVRPNTPHYLYRNYHSSVLILARSLGAAST